MKVAYVTKSEIQKVLLPEIVLRQKIGCFVRTTSLTLGTISLEPPFSSESTNHWVNSFLSICLATYAIGLNLSQLWVDLLYSLAGFYLRSWNRIYEWFLKFGKPPWKRM